MKLRPVLAAAAATLAAAAPAAGASGYRISILGQSHAPLAGAPWAYYVKAWGPDGKPFQGTIMLEVVTPKGKKVDGIGLFAFTGSWLRAYIWRRPDKGQTLDLKVSLLAGTKVVASRAYRVSVR
jgi:hypothetical protein